MLTLLNDLLIWSAMRILMAMVSVQLIAITSVACMCSLWAQARALQAIFLRLPLFIHTIQRHNSLCTNSLTV